MFAAISGGLVDERLEQLQILARLGMPQHAEREPPLGILDRLDRAVLGVRRGPQAAAEPAKRLVVMRLNGSMVAHDRAEPRSFFDHHIVVGEDAGRVLVPLVTDHLRQVLNQVAAERHVQHLRPAADRENGHVAGKRSLQQSQLRAVARQDDASRLGMRLLPVQLGIEIGPAGEDEAVQRVERLVHAVLRRRDEQRPTAGALDRTDVVGRNERGLDLPHAEPRRRDVRRDPDDRQHLPALGQALARPARDDFVEQPLLSAPGVV